jgi:ABC-type amino acid transport substrate-binding protein
MSNNIVLAQESTLSKILRTNTLNVGFSQYFPYAYIDETTKNKVGISVEIIQLMAEALGVKTINWSEVTMATFIAALQGNIIDLQPQITITPPRALVIDFSHIYSRAPLSLVINKKDADKFPNIESLNKPGVKISVAQGTDNDLYGSRYFDKAEIVRIKTPPEALLALVSGRVDAHAAPLSQLDAVVKSNTELSIVKGYYATTRSGIAVRQGDQIWLNWINQFVDDLEESGVFDKIFAKYNSVRYTLNDKKLIK